MAQEQKLQWSTPLMLPSIGFFLSSRHSSPVGRTARQNCLLKSLARMCTLTGMCSPTRIFLLLERFLLLDCVLFVLGNAIYPRGRSINDSSPLSSLNSSSCNHPPPPPPSLPRQCLSRSCSCYCPGILLSTKIPPGRGGKGLGKGHVEEGAMGKEDWKRGGVG